MGLHYTRSRKLDGSFAELDCQLKARHQERELAALMLARRMAHTSAGMVSKPHMNVSYSRFPTLRIAQRYMFLREIDIVTRRVMVGCFVRTVPPAPSTKRKLPANLPGSPDSVRLRVQIPNHV